MEMRIMLVSGFRWYRTLAHRPECNYWPRMHLHPRRRPRPPRPRRWWSRCVPLASSFSFKTGKDLVIMRWRFDQLRKIFKALQNFYKNYRGAAYSSSSSESKDSSSSDSGGRRAPGDPGDPDLKEHEQVDWRQSLTALLALITPFLLRSRSC